MIFICRFSSHFVIYGIALITTEMFSREDKCRGIHVSSTVMRKHDGCKPLDTHDYLHYFVIMSSDLLGKLMRCFHSFTHLFIHSVIHSFIHSFIYSFVCSFVHSFTHSFVLPSILLFIHSFVRSSILYKEGRQLP